ncbi:MAG: sugar ABC transporter permease, partial [Staphylococcus equorum]|nr:sugar ABC transporter permease [Staphylococcus equorum]
MNKKWLPYALLLPSVIIILIFNIIPLIYTVYLRFFDWNMVKTHKEFVGLNNYIDLFTDPKFYMIIVQTFAYIALLIV